MAQDSDEPKEERKLEPYHYEAMIRAEVEKRLAAEKQAEVISQPPSPPVYYESPPPHLAPQQPTTGFPIPYQQPGQYPAQQTGQYYPGQIQPQQYQSGPIPYPQQYSQPQPQPYYQPPPAQPVINVVVQNTNVNQNRNYVRGGGYYRRSAAHGHIGCFNVCYFLFIGWALGMTWGFVGLCLLPFDRRAADAIFRQTFFLSFLA
jgi:hypothetical protein